MLVKTFGSALLGLDATTITIEVNVTKGVNFFLVGLPDNAIKESHKRIKAALSNNDYKFPVKLWTINMAPADLKKEGASFDLPLAVGILAASNQIKGDSLKDYIILGELSLDGSVNPIKGALPIALQAQKNGFKGVILPKESAAEAAVIDGIDVYGVSHIKEVVDFFNEESDLTTEVKPEDIFNSKSKEGIPDFVDVKGQFNIKRAFEIAAAGGHNVILIGPPGSGKSMLAKRLPSILPPMSLEESLETTKIHSVAGRTRGSGLVTERPFRKPHHTISDVALVGGGGWPQPGEISLAHNGVLFLDELPEYKRTVLEVMRQPLEDRVVTISRARFTVDYPAGFMLIAAMNPCPCGYYNHPEKECNCGPGVVQRYLSKISGPLLDRIDLHVEVTPVSFDELMDDNTKQEGSDTIRDRVTESRKLQIGRFKENTEVHCNAQMGSSEIKECCVLDQISRELLKNAMEKLDLSARAYDRIIKVARTIADLEAEPSINSSHIAEAIQYRSLDKQGWAG